ncbi:hypothetical protein [Polyangium sp. 15x6]|uniref:hypothetical protein n=1 Tax=Polyangium sp. 15x6 TaxID=3042687 RepID=UPI00249C7BBC|nr:hypothetical protein [Polyangium sp. 15x6]MDI3283415.1 hypothetical protein [Polyangium sp. 15x6]
MSILRLLGVVGLSAFFVGCGGEVPENDSPDEPGTTLWVRRFGRDSYVAPVGLAGVASGGVIVAGQHYGDIDLGGGTLPSPSNSYQAYVARYDGEGNHVYSRSFGAEFSEGAIDVAALPDGSALVAGQFAWPVELDGISLPHDGADDTFVAKLDPAGKVVWARAFGGADDQRPIAIAAMPDGGAVLVGSTSGELPTISSNADFIVRLDPEGTPLWSRMLDSNQGYVTSHDVAARDGVIAVVGEFMKDMGFDVELVASGHRDGFVMTYDFDGKPLWGRAVGGDESVDSTNAVAFTDDGGLVLTGHVDGDVDFGGGIVSDSFEDSTNVDDTNTFLLELDANANHRRSAIYGGLGTDSGLGLAMASDGSVILTGNMYRRISFGMAYLMASEDEYRGDAFVAELDADRNPVFLRRFGGTELQWGQAAAVDGQGRVYIAGTALGAVDFGLGPTPGTGYYETFLVALAP